jgi:endonuclease YncB( thermonuclease family)
LISSSGATLLRAEPENPNTKKGFFRGNISKWLHQEERLLLPLALPENAPHGVPLKPVFSHNAGMNPFRAASAVFLAALLAVAPLLWAETFSSRVVGVVDGDTLRVSRKEGGMVKVRLYGVDCPEMKQSYGKEARRLTVKLAYGRVVFVEKRGKYPYGGIVGRVSLPSGKLLSQELVGAGACWGYKRYAPKSETLPISYRQS